jgi:Nuclease-related domain
MGCRYSGNMGVAQPLDPGEAGGSARLKAERLREEYEAARARRSDLGRVFTALFPSEQEKRLLQDERNWLTGAEGEQNLAKTLAQRCPEVPLLHDRRAPMSGANIDHIAIAPSGVYVIDCKRYRGKIEVAQPLFGKAKLKINGRGRTKLIDGLDGQVAHVKAALAEIADDVPVHGCLCFVAPEGFLAESGLPVLQTLKINGYPLYYPRRLVKRLNRAGPLTPARAQILQAELAQRLPQAVHD